MALQEILVSYGVEVDETGLYRLNRILSDNRTRAAALQSAYVQAEQALRRLLTVMGQANLLPGKSPAAKSAPSGTSPSPEPSGTSGTLGPNTPSVPTVPDMLTAPVVTDPNLSSVAGLKEPVTSAATPGKTPGTDLTGADAPALRSEIDLTGIEVPVLKPDIDLTGLESPVLKPDIDLSGLEPPVLKPEIDLTGLEPPALKPNFDLSGIETPILKPDIDLSGVEPPLLKPDIDLSGVEPPVLKPELDLSDTEPPVLTPEIEAPDPASLFPEPVPVSSLFPEPLAPPLDMKSLTGQVESALREAVRYPLSPVADMGAFLSGVRSALETAREEAAATVLTMNIGVRLNTKDAGRGLLTWSLKQFALGGRIDQPTLAEIAEDGSPEYVIPVTKEEQALPLIRRMLAELSDRAKASIASGLSGFAPGLASAPGGAFPGLSALFPGISMTEVRNIQAPCTIQVSADGADAASVGQAAYDAAEAHLVRVLQGVYQ